MVRVLFLITEFDRGGAEKALYDIVRGLDRGRFAPSVACLGPPGYYTEKYRGLGIPVEHLGLRARGGPKAAGFPLAVVRCVLRLARLLRRERIQVLQTFLFHANMVGRFAGALSRTPVVLGAVRTAEPRHTHTLADGLTFRLTDGEVCVSEYVRGFQASRAGLCEGRLFVVPQGVDEEEYALPAAPFGLGSPEAVARRRVAREDLGLPHDRPVFAFVGRLCAAKALPDLLAAFSEVSRRAGRPLLAIGGDGPLAAMVRGSVGRMGLAADVCLLGWLDEPSLLYSAADCLVLSSVVEGMPRVVLEAMAVALPVVSTDAPGCDELIQNGETGFLVTRGRPGELASRMALLLGDPPLAARMGCSGRARALGSFGLRDIVKRYEDLYVGLLHGSRAGRNEGPYVE